MDTPFAVGARWSETLAVLAVLAAGAVVARWAVRKRRSR